MSMPGVTQSGGLVLSMPDQIPPELNYEYGGFYYTVAHSNRKRAFVALPDFTAAQVQELVEGKMDNSKCFPPENGSQSFGFTHCWIDDQYKVLMVVEDGVFTYTVYDETGEEIYEETIPQTDCKGVLLPAGEIFSRYCRSTLFFDEGEKPHFLYYICRSNLTWEDRIFFHPPTWTWEDKTLSLLKKDGQFIWQIFHRATKTTSHVAFGDTQLENPGNHFYEERFYNELPPEDCPIFLLDQEHVDVGQLLDSASAENQEVLIHRMAELIQTYSMKIFGIPGTSLQSIVFRPSTTYISIQSRLDPKITVDENYWAVTLVNSKAPTLKWPFGHAVLLIEKVKDYQFIMLRAHFTVAGGSALVGISPGNVECKEVDPSCHYHSKTETWSLPRLKVELMIAEIKEEVRRQERGETPVYFGGRGHGTVFIPRVIETPDGLKRVENCLSWAVKKLLSHGAVFYHLPEGTFMNRPAEFISSYASNREQAIRSQGEELRRVQRTFRMNPSTEIPIHPLQNRTSLRFRFVLSILGFRHVPLMSHEPLHRALIDRVGEVVQTFFPNLERNFDITIDFFRALLVRLALLSASGDERERIISRYLRSLYREGRINDPDPRHLGYPYYQFIISDPLQRYLEISRSTNRLLQL